jgi:glycosyltransferase involved in cell wall biosynthesis
VLARALASIFDQLNEPLARQVEVCVTDNASEDGTERLIASLRAQHGERLRYLRHERDLGASRNLLSCIELARSDYCWALSSDDMVVDGSIARVLELIESAPAPPGVLVGKANFDLTLTRLSSQGGADFYPPEQHRTIRYADAEQFISDCGLLVTVVSTLVVRRDSWRSALAALGGDSLAEKTMFPHVPIVIAMTRRDPSWIWCPAKLLKVRVGNAAVARDEGWSTDQIHTSYLRDLARLWSRCLGRRSKARSVLTLRAYRSFITPERLRASAPGGRSLCRRAQLLVAYIPMFWRVPAFWTHTAPMLVLTRGTRRGQRRDPLQAIDFDQRLAHIDASLPEPELPESHELALALRIENRSRRTFGSTGARRVVVGYRWEDETGKVALQGPGTPLPRDLTPDAGLVCTLHVLTPTAPGRYGLRLALAQEDVGWFDDRAPEFACMLRAEIRRYGWTDRPRPGS